MCVLLWVLLRRRKFSRSDKGSISEKGTRPSARDRFWQSLPISLRARLPQRSVSGWENLEAPLPPAPAPTKAARNTDRPESYVSVAGPDLGTVFPAGYSDMERRHNGGPVMTQGAASTRLKLTNPDNRASEYPRGSSSPFNSSLNTAMGYHGSQTGSGGKATPQGNRTFFDQSELSRKPSEAYDPERRRVNRSSDLSSISSGFGDGDIVIPDSMLEGVSQQPQQRPQQQQQRRTRNTLLSRFSQFARGNTDRDRDTVYSQGGDDVAPRFRTVASWVNQQSSRVKHGQAGGADPFAPPLPGSYNGLPPEQRFDMMIDDGERPRRVDGSLRR